ncbi:hypothetical protein BBK36DRAFT_105703 [Trichoderma citrinoviride]|uniref:Uncharacterized protein n=1 Tax=Trichoderma citrinoviride TaxID=58853 RepID=A0A2T4AWS0_9HYPO|nr:hypothetical protein BBK36DRAFT_105703 [Trichoderma citrinoviride]PTB61505.1 hypothetical protein BBK36DRAFT_105703 [Trichoderma citrinoviride]
MPITISIDPLHIFPPLRLCKPASYQTESVHDHIPLTSLVDRRLAPWLILAVPPSSDQKVKSYCTLSSSSSSPSCLLTNPTLGSRAHRPNHRLPPLTPPTSTQCCQSLPAPIPKHQASSKSSPHLHDPRLPSLIRQSTK